MVEGEFFDVRLSRTAEAGQAMLMNGSLLIFVVLRASNLNTSVACVYVSVCV